MSVSHVSELNKKALLKNKATVLKSLKTPRLHSVFDEENTRENEMF